MKISLSGIVRAKITMWLIMVVLLLYPLYPALTGTIEFIADPAKYLLDYYGKVATALFVAVGCFSPLRIIWPRWSVAIALNRHRRLVGVCCFYFVVLHVGLYFLYLGGLAFHEFTVENLFLWSGLLAFLILAMLSVTSLRVVVRWLGGRRWKALHRSVYLAAFLIFYHQAAQEKAGASDALLYFTPLVVLQLTRIAVVWRRKLSHGKGKDGIGG